MARPIVNIVVATVTSYILFLIGESNRSASPPLVLPLFSYSNNSSGTFRNSRHLLGRSNSKLHPNAHMRLYDDLLRYGYYTTRLWIGTPPQRFALIVDTGSTVTYVPCSSCEQCGTHEDPEFQPELSSTYQPVKCTADCTCDQDRKQCVYERQYAEMSSTSGVLGEDIISFGNQSELVPQRAVFGCEIAETGDLYSQHADGIMGLGRGDYSVVDQLVSKGVISDSFSLCYGGMGIDGGAMVLGSISAPSDMVFSFSDPDRSPYYNIDLKEIHVGGKPLPLVPSVFDGKYGTVLDSGTTYAYLPEMAYVAFKDAIMEELSSLKQIRGPDPSFNDICFSGADSHVSDLTEIFPKIELVFGNQQKILLSPENYLFQHSKVPGAYCLGIFQNDKDPTTLLGGIVVRNTLVTYDREHLKIGFWKTNCSELWERLHTTGSPSPSPSPSSSSGKDISSVILPPMLAPDGSPRYALPGNIQIGQITLDMSLSTNYSYLKPHINELVEIIAKELDVDASQVHLLNFTSEGNSSLVTWGIVPLGSETYISNITASNIISQLAEHHVMLPDTFGNYQLEQWKVEPSVQRTWWQQYYLVILLATIITIIIVISALGVWIIWKYRQQTYIPYKPVDEAIPEQEMQPLES